MTRLRSWGGLGGSRALRPIREALSCQMIPTLPANADQAKPADQPESAGLTRMELSP